MKRTAITYSLMIILISSCATLNISDIQNLEKVKFDSLSLIPDMETNNLRIDLIRQTYEENVTDSTKETKETPYHPIGFDLGNGLFYDLNENLCLRLDCIMEFSRDNDFEIQKITRPEKNKGYIIYSYIKDSLLVQYPPRKKIHYRYHRVNHLDSTAFMYKKRLKYAVIETDSSLIYSGKKRKWDIIKKIDNNNYYLNKRKWKQEYKIKSNDIFLENDYIVSLTNNDSTIEIKSYRKKRKNRILYTIEKDSDKLFIYNKNYSGILIEKEGNNILVYRNKTLLRKYELKSGANNL
jgi:hypothetical protein